MFTPCREVRRSVAAWHRGLRCGAEAKQSCSPRIDTRIVPLPGRLRTRIIGALNALNVAALPTRRTGIGPRSGARTPSERCLVPDACTVVGRKANRRVARRAPGRHGRLLARSYRRKLRKSSSVSLCSKQPICAPNLRRY